MDEARLLLYMRIVRGLCARRGVRHPYDQDDLVQEAATQMIRLEKRWPLLSDGTYAVYGKTVAARLIKKFLAQRNPVFASDLAMSGRLSAGGCEGLSPLDGFNPIPQPVRPKRSNASRSETRRPSC